MRKLCIHLLLAAAALAMTAGAALAHAALRHATPAAGAVLRESPAELTIEFSEAVDQSRVELKLTHDDGAPVVLVRLESEPASGALVSRLVGENLKPDAYHVFWRVISLDGHWTRGDYTFEVTAR